MRYVVNVGRPASGHAPVLSALGTIAIAVALLIPAVAGAHNGSTDAYGCHKDNKAGNYHCHGGIFSGRTFASKDAMLDLLGQGDSTTASSSLPNLPDSLPDSLPDPPPTSPLPGSPAAAYDRNAYLPRWADVDGDCQDTRDEVLISESLAPVILDARGCNVVRGLWFDPYTGQEYNDPRDLDIDHMVPLKEAHISGAYLWTTAQKRAYANDQTNRLVLIAVDRGENRSKSDRDPAEWMPPNTAYRCDYMRSWVAVKQAYGLGIDSAEQAAIDSVISPASKALPTQAEGAWSISAAGVEVDAIFSIGLSRMDSCGYQETARVSDVVTISGEIQPLPEHIGQIVDIYLVDRVNMAFTMRNQAGAFVPWNGYTADLVPVMTAVTLTETLRLDVFRGELGISGDHRIFLGYTVSDGQLIYTPVPVRVNITP